MKVRLRSLPLLTASALLFAAIIAPFLKPQVVQAQKKEDSSAPTLTIKSTIRRVVVDVTVKDAKGQPVMDLRPEDFKVFEDGALQSMRSFEKHEPAISSENATAPELPPNTFTNFSTAPENGPTNILLAEMHALDLLPYQALRGFVERMPARSKYALLTLKCMDPTDPTACRLHLLQGVTEDRCALQAALRSHFAKPSLSDLSGIEREVGVQMGSMTELARFVAAIPGRKNLIWIASNFSLVPTMDNLQSEMAASLPFARSSQLAQVQAGLAQIGRDRGELRDLALAFAAGQVAIYPVNVNGITTPIDAITTAVDSHAGLIRLSSNESGFLIGSSSLANRIAVDNVWSAA